MADTTTVFTEIAYEVADGVATITLDRPEKLNAFTGVMMFELLQALDLVDGDDAVRAVVVTGRVRGFCAGADLSSGGDTFNSDERREQARRLGITGSQGQHRDGGGLVTLRMFRCLKPIIGAINGPAVGIGATMTLPMDMRVASEEARFGFVFTRRGIVPEAASSWFLPRVVGISRAMEWCATGRLFGAGEALEGGLVRSVHPAGELLPAAYGLAREIADNTSPVSVALARQMMWRMLGADDPMEAHKVDSPAIAARGASADAVEGVMSFLEKRPAVFPLTVSSDMPDLFPWWEERAFD
jgi:enoyl-CoA hydratase/carnithine racemase